MAHFNAATEEVARVYLNDKLLLTAVEADEEEGWADIWDISVVAPLISEEFHDDEPAELQEVPVKRLFGKVEIRK